VLKKGGEKKKHLGKKVFKNWIHPSFIKVVDAFFFIKHSKYVYVFLSIRKYLRKAESSSVGRNGLKFTVCSILSVLSSSFDWRKIDDRSITWTGVGYLPTSVLLFLCRNVSCAVTQLNWVWWRRVCLTEPCLCLRRGARYVCNVTWRQVLRPWSKVPAGTLSRLYDRYSYDGFKRFRKRLFPHSVRRGTCSRN